MRMIRNIAQWLRPAFEQGLKGAMGLMSLIGLTGLGLALIASCSSDPELLPQEMTVERPSVEVNEVKGLVAAFTEVGGPQSVQKSPAAVTRGWLPPSGYDLYPNSELSIGVFFTQNPAAPGGYEEEYFYMQNGKWRVSMEELEPTTYYLYGYVPRDKSINASVALLPGGGKTYADGAVLTLENVPTVSSADLCMVIAAHNGKDDYSADEDYSVSDLVRGDFSYEAQGTGVGGGGNYVYLLLDHLFSALRISMRVNGNYHALRTIKLKSMQVQTFNGSTSTRKKTDIAITLTKTDGGLNPVSDVTFSPIADSGTSGSKVMESEDGVTLTTEPTTFQSHFMPHGVTKLVLTSIYDVYDKNVTPEHPEGNLVRKDCTATNVLDISELFSGQSEALRGRRYTINLTINPTYLYVLSEPDLDNPSVELTNE